MKITVQQIRALKNKDEEVFRSIYEYYYDLVLYSVLKIVGNREVSEEVVNDTFYTLFIKMETFDEDMAESFQSWLFTIAKNKAIDVARKIDLIVLNEEIVNNQPYIEGESFFETMAIFKDILSEEEMDIVMYKLYYNKSFKEISQIMNKPLTTISSKFSKAKKAMRKAWGGLRDEDV